LEQYIKFIKDRKVGLEGTSCWCWYETNGRWESKGFACDTIEESLNLLEQFIYEGGIQ
jgi:hypothetical protein